MAAIRLLAVSQSLQNVGCRNAINLHDLLPRGLAADQSHFAARTIQRFCQQAEQGLIRRRVHGWRGDFDAEFRAMRIADYVLRGARLQLDGESDAVGLGGMKEGRAAGKLFFALVSIVFLPCISDEFCQNHVRDELK